MNHQLLLPPELVREWVREANHNEPMFAQVAQMAANWGFLQAQLMYGLPTAGAADT